MRTIELTGRYLDPEGNAAKIELRFTPSSALKNSTENIIVLGEPVYALTNGDGDFSVDLYPQQTDLVPDNFLYLVEELVGRTIIQSWWIALGPDSPDVVSLPTLYPTEPPPPTPGVYPTLSDVQAIAGDLDRSIYNQLAALSLLVSSNTTLITTKVNVTDIGVTVPELINGVIPIGEIPAIRFQNSYSAQSDTEMMALFAQMGDICIRPDQGRSYVLGASDPTVLSNWKVISSDFSVTSVNALTGDVILTAISIGAAPTVHNHDVLSGYNYAATYMRSSTDNVLELLNVSDNGSAVQVSNQAVSWLDATGRLIYKMDPYNPLPWSPFAVTVFDATNTPITTGAMVVNAQARPVTPDNVSVMMTITNWLNGSSLAFVDATASNGIYTGIFGSWSALRPDGTTLGAGVATVNSAKVIELAGLTQVTSGSGLTQTQLTIMVYGTYQTPYVATTDLLPNPNNNYRLQVGQVTAGALDAEISGNWPVQTLNLSLPVGNVLALHTGDPLPAGTPSGTVVARYSPGTGERPATVTVVG
jgi:hypothetical protein